MKKRAAILMSLTLLLGGCLEELNQLGDIDEVALSPRVAFPIIDSRVSFSDFEDDIENFAITTDPDGTLVLNYSRDLTEAIAEDYFSILNQSSPIVTITGLTSFGMPLNGTITAQGSDVLQFAVDDGERIETLELKSGILRLVVNSSYQVTTKATFTIASLIVGGVPFQQEITVTPGNTEIEVDITGASMDLTNGGGDFNELNYVLDIELTGNGNTVEPTQSLEGYFQLQDPIFTLITGEGNYREIDTRTGTEDINVLENVNVGSFVIADPTLSLSIRNSFGVPFEIDLAEFKVTDKEGVETNLSGDIVDTQNPYLIQAPAFNQMGEAVTTLIELNSTNSNLSELVSAIPREISYEATAIYPGGNGKIFVQDTSSIKIAADVRVPLYGSFMDFSFSEEFELDGVEIDVVEEAEITIQTVNHTALETGIILTFKDDQGNTLLQLLQDDPLLTEASPVDGDGAVTGETTNELVIALSKQNLEDIANVASLEIQFLMETTDDGSVLIRIKDSDYIEIKVGIEGKLKIGSDG